MAASVPTASGRGRSIRDGWLWVLVTPDMSRQNLDGPFSGVDDGARFPRQFRPRAVSPADAAGAYSMTACLKRSIASFSPNLLGNATSSAAGK